MTPRIAGRVWTAYVAGVAAWLLFTACAAPTPTTRDARIFATPVSLTLYESDPDATFEACFARLREIDRELTMWEPDSELSKLNARAGLGPISASSDLLRVAGRGIELARVTGGIFDPSVAPLVRLWGVGTDHASVPADSEIAAVRPLVDWKRVVVDPKAGTVTLNTGMAMDFGALAKGYGAIEAASLLSERGVKSALLAVGGCIVALGSGPGGRAWRVGIQDPNQQRGSSLGYLAIRDAMVDTSGVYESYFEANGQRYVHIMDTRTGRPVQGSLISATLMTPLSVNADGPPLALLVLGPEAGLALAEAQGWAAVLVSKDKKVYLSKAARPLFTLTDSSYAIVN